MGMCIRERPNCGFWGGDESRMIKLEMTRIHEIYLFS